MKNEKLLLFLLAIIQFAHIIDFMIIMPLGAQFMEIFQIDPQQFSFIVTIYAAAAFISGLLSALFIDRFDRKHALLYMYIGFTLGTLLCAIAPNYLLFLMARGLTGAFGGILGALIFAIIGDVIPFERRASATGIVMTAFSVASIAGVPLGLHLAAAYGWRMPFIAIGTFSLFIIAAIVFLIPNMTRHITIGKVQQNPFAVLRQMVHNQNQMSALLFSIVLMLGHFTIIPFIAPYMQLNIGFSNHDIKYIYLFGGLATAILLPIFGRLSDRFGNARIFTIASILALFSIYGITNLPPVTMLIALCVTSSYFIVASGRSVPAMTMVTAVVKPENRGSFMSVRSSMNEMALALSSALAGFIIVKNPDGSLGNYEWVGYVAILMSIVAIFIAHRLKVID